MASRPLATLPDGDLLRALHDLVARDRKLEADLLTHLAEVDARLLYLEEGCSSMFAYCTEVLRFSGAQAYDRIQAARAARSYPAVRERIRRGEIHLSGVKLLAPHLTPENHVELLDRARHRSKRAIEEFLADRAPKPDAPSIVRRLPQARSCTGAVDRPSPDATSEVTELGTSGTTASAPAARSTSPPPSPLGRERFKIQFTAGPALREKLREAQALLRHQVPNGDMAQIFDRALTLLVEDARRRKFGETSRPVARRSAHERGPASRHIPAEIRRSVTARDQEQCAFVARNGRRCGSRDFVEFHHLEPWARARRHSVEGIELRCRAHNHHAAVGDYGAAHMQRCREGGSTSTSTRPGTSCSEADRTFPPTRPGTSSTGAVSPGSG